MDNDKHRSTIVPVAVTLRSEQEPVESEGSYMPLDDGFILEFLIGDSKYKLTQNAGRTELSVDGLLSYCIDFGGAATSVLKTPFGDAEYTVEPEPVKAERNADGIQVLLNYSLSIGGEKLRRAVDVSALFLNQR